MTAIALAISARGARGQTVADESVAKRVDSLVNAELRSQHIPGIAVGVMRAGHVIKATGYGLANIELQVPVTPETIFQTGSVGKQFTATAIMMLVLAHGGAWQGFTMQISRYVDDRLTVVVFTNLDEDHSHPARIASGIASLYLPSLSPTT